LLEQFVSSIARRIPETFIGNNKKITPKDIKKSKLGVQKPKAKKTVKTVKPKTAVKKMTKVKKAWFQQLRIIYAIDFSIYGNKLHALEVSKSYRHSFDLAKEKINQLEKTQKLKEVAAN